MMPPYGATGLDGSDKSTFGSERGFAAPSSTSTIDSGDPTLSRTGGFATVIGDSHADAAAHELEGEDWFGSGFTDAIAMQLYRQSYSQSTSFFQTAVRPKWARSYRAFRNEHFEGSKYHSDVYKSRSKNFRPKTRSAVRKSMATAAKALFSTGDVVSVTPQNESDDQQTAAAALKQEILNYRLSRTTRRNGIPWFSVAMGARFDSLMTGLCCSKQSWTYKVDARKGPDRNVVDPRTGVAMRMAGEGSKRVLIDKPSIDLLPPENVLFDPNCDWTCIGQSSRYVHLRFPMGVEEAWGMISRNHNSDIPWRAITKEQLRSHVKSSSPGDTLNVRAAREGGKDPYMQTSGEFAPIWLVETFMQYDGVDYCYWTLDGNILLSDPIPTEEAYPFMHGERPIVIGTGALEPHRPYPMSSVESWQPLQQEINDSTNLRLDHMKQIVTPPMIVVRGRKVDVEQVSRRGPNSIIMVQGAGDATPMELPDTPASAFQENNQMNSDFDDLAAIFNAGSVQNSQQMNETVGGMRIIAGAADPVADFDLSVWAETWAEPVLWQIIKLEEMYETDATVIQIAGSRAKLWLKYGISEITDELLASESSLKLNLGVGSTTMPLERIQKFGLAWKAASEAITPFVQSGAVKVKIKAKEIIETCFGAAGFQDAGDRFFESIEDGPDPSQQPPPPDPKLQIEQGKLEVQKQKLAMDQQKTQAQSLIQAHQINNNAQNSRSKLINDAQQRKTSVEVAHMKAMAEMTRAHAEMGHAAGTQARDHVHDHMKATLAALHQRLAPPPQATGGGGKGGGGGSTSSPGMMTQEPLPDMRGMF